MATLQSLNMVLVDILSSRSSAGTELCYEILGHALLRKSHTGQQKEGATGPANRHVVTLVGRRSPLTMGPTK
jgi:hypothetical protein